MKFIHSLNTKPFNINLYNTNSTIRKYGNIIYYALSLAYLKRLGVQTVLYTDKLGQELLDFLPYDEIKLIDIPDSISPRFWAASKMDALSKEDVPVIHIDGDVFIKSEKLLNIIESTEYDVLVQQYEQGYWYKRDTSIFWREPEFCKSIGINLEDTQAYNTGILAFKNSNIKEEFTNRYKQIVHYFSNKYKQELDTLAYCTPDLLAEQHLIYNLSQDSKVFQLLPKDHNLAQAKAIDLGYQHVLSTIKFEYLVQCMQILQKLNPKIYTETYKKVQNFV